MTKKCLVTFRKPTILSAKLPTSQEMAKFDNDTISSGVPAYELMERVGRAVAFEISLLSKPEDLIVIFCGPGNNGGDGLAVGRYLSFMKRRVRLFVVVAKKYSPLCEVQMSIAEQNDMPVYFVGDLSLLNQSIDCSNITNSLNKAKVIVDGLLGNGQVGEPRGAIRECLELIEVTQDSSNNRPLKISLDIPTGACADDGSVSEVCFNADITYTIQTTKIGTLFQPMKDKCGEVKVIPIGIDCSQFTEFEWVEYKQHPKFLKSYLGHKKSNGTVYVIGGSETFPGAVNLAAIAALKSGAGYVVKSSPGVDNCEYSEIIRYPVATNDQFFEEKHVDEVYLKALESDLVILGPGLGTRSETIRFMTKLIKRLENYQGTILIDADGLNIIANQRNAINLHKLKSLILTPHIGEAARLLGKQSNFVENNRINCVRELAKLFNGVIVLKGPGTIIYSKDRGFVSSSGNAWMGTAGTGDVLAGVIGGIVAKNYDQLPLLDLVAHSVMLHGEAAELFQKEQGRVMIASDLLTPISILVANETVIVQQI